MAELLKQSIIKYCKKIATDPLLVQGAGGNISWKTKDVLWIKASGTWLMDANVKDIFVPVDLHHLKTEIAQNHFDIIPQGMRECVLRPSIETLLHAIMPHSIVVHLHPINILAHVVRYDWLKILKEKIAAHISWTSVEYHKPGGQLAQALKRAISSSEHKINVVFLQNHGVIVGGDNINEIDNTIVQLMEQLYAPKIQISHDRCSSHLELIVNADGVEYSPIKDNELHQLALESRLFNRLKTDWALYPDHVVFLGSEPVLYESRNSFLDDVQNFSKKSSLVFVKNDGVYVSKKFNLAQMVQLRCYYDVISRQQDEFEMNKLTLKQIYELLNWDAEHYRMALAK